MAKKTVREKLTPYDPAEDLGSDEAIAVFMAEAFQTNDAGYIAHALGVVARAKGMAQIASQTGLSREQLYRSFSEKGEPDAEDNSGGDGGPRRQADCKDPYCGVRRTGPFDKLRAGCPGGRRLRAMRTCRPGGRRLRAMRFVISHPFAKCAKG